MPGGHGTPAGQGLGPKRGGRPSERRSEQSDRRGTLAGRPPREPPCRHGGDVQPRRPAEHRCLRGAEGPLAWAVCTSPLRPRAPRAPLPPAVREHVARAPRDLCSCCHVPQDARLPALRSAPTPERLPRPASPSLPLAPRSCTRPSADVDGGVCCPPAARTRPLQEGGGVAGSPLAAPRCLPVRGAWLAFAEWRGLAYGYNLYGYHLHPILKTRNRMSS